MDLKPSNGQDWDLEVDKVFRNCLNHSSGSNSVYYSWMSTGEAENGIELEEFNQVRV